MQRIEKITKEIFYKLEKHIKKTNNDSDMSSFDVIKKKLNSFTILSDVDFVKEIFYVIMTSGFNQKTAKKYYLKIIDYLDKNNKISYTDLLTIFHNKNKIKAIESIWNNRTDIHNKFYKLKSNEEKLNFLFNLPYIGEITKYHIARNLGINVVKYDIWIQRLSIALLKSNLKVNTSKLSSDVKKICDNMFDEISKITGEKIGYIDVVLWKSCQKKFLLIDNENKEVFLNIE